MKFILEDDKDEPVIKLRLARSGDEVALTAKATGEGRNDLLRINADGVVTIFRDGEVVRLWLSEKGHIL